MVGASLRQGWGEGLRRKAETFGYRLKDAGQIGGQDASEPFDQECSLEDQMASLLIALSFSESW
jgi:hypothetical protein